MINPNPKLLQYSNCDNSNCDTSTTQIVRKLKTLNCGKTQKLNIDKTQIVRKLKNSNDEKLRNTGSDKTQGQTATKHKTSNHDQSQKLK